MSSKTSRRHFLRTSTALSAMGASSPIALNLAAVASASAQTAPSDYRALVCLNLGGGNDHLNTYVPFDATSYTRYAATRGPLAQAKPGSALATTRSQGGRQIGLNANLAGVGSLYSAGRLALLAGVGPLRAPSSKADLLAGRVAMPAQVGSHNDQANTWMSLATSNPYGWGGRMGDLLAASNGTAANFTTVSGTGGYTLFLVGDSTAFFSVSDGGIPSAFFDGYPAMTAAVLGGGTSRRTNLLEQAYVAVHERLQAGAATLQGRALPESTFPAPNATNLTAGQLRTVARLIGANRDIGVKRQVFFVELGGFDTHGGQTDRHASLLQQLNEALVYFDGLLGQLNLRNSVTLFTTSEFGRTFNSNGDGTDHGWASHHMVLGGAVRGREIYGTLPTIDPNGPDFIDGGVMIPTTAVEQYGATLGRWMGLSPTQLADIFPNLGRFASTDLGFLG